MRTLEHAPRRAPSQSQLHSEPNASQPSPKILQYGTFNTGWLCEPPPPTHIVIIYSIRGSRGSPKPSAPNSRAPLPRAPFSMLQNQNEALHTVPVLSLSPRSCSKHIAPSNLGLANFSSVIPKKRYTRGGGDGSSIAWPLPFAMPCPVNGDGRSSLDLLHLSKISYTSHNRSELTNPPDKKKKVRSTFSLFSSPACL